MLNTKEKNMNKYYLYYGISLLYNEDNVFTIGITKDCFRRSYEKHMSIVWVKAYASKAEAMKAEKALHAILDAKFDRAFVQFGAWQMEGYKQNRGWDWWLGAGLDIVKLEVE